MDDVRYVIGTTPGFMQPHSLLVQLHALPANYRPPPPLFARSTRIPIEMLTEAEALQRFRALMIYARSKRPGSH